MVFFSELAHERSLLCYHIAQRHSREPTTLCVNCKWDGLSGTRFSLWGVSLLMPKALRLKRVPLNQLARQFSKSMND